jgi:hypothetical protein
MAKQTINIGSVANDGTGDPLRTAFDKINDNFTELYDDDAGDVNSVNGQTGAVTLDTDDVSQGSTNLYNQTHTGDVTGSTALTIAADAVDGSNIADDSIDSEHYVDGSIDTAHIANDNITHDKLEARYTAQASISTLTGTVSFDCSTASSFKLSGDLTGAYTIDLSNYKKGQVITIYPLKAQSVTLDAQGSSTNTFNKIGAVDYDNSTSSILQIECVDDSSTDPVFFYSIATFASDSTI